MRTPVEILALASCALAWQGCQRSGAPDAPGAPVGALVSGYALHDLGPGRCLAISDDGLIAGFAEGLVDDPRAATFDDQTRTGPFLLFPDGRGGYDRTFLGKRDSRDRYSVLDQIRGGRLSGFTQGPDHSEAVLYDRAQSKWVTLGALQPDDLTQAVGLTIDGWAAGLDRTFPAEGAPFNHAVLYPPEGPVIDVGLAVTRALGGPRSVGIATNAWGLVVGIGETGQSLQRGFTYDRATATVTGLGTLGGPTSEATAVNGRGDVAGRSELPDGARHAFVRWAGTTVLDDVGTLGVAPSSVQALNDQGVVLGRSVDGSGQAHPSVAARGPDGWKSLDLSVEDGSRYRSLNAVSINGKGEIVGDGLPTAGRDRHCIEWSPR